MSRPDTGFVHRPATIALLVVVAWTGVLAGCSSSEREVPTNEPPSAQADTSGEAASDSTAAVPPPTSTNKGRSVAERVADASLATRVKTALTESTELRTFDFDPSATDGRVTLSGDVATRELGRAAAARAADVDDVDGVVNRLTVEGEQVAWNASSSSESEEPVAPAGQGETGEGRYHTVRTGESLWAIANKYDTTPRRVRELNGLSGNNLQPGERLMVARGSESGGGSKADSPNASGGPAVADASQQNISGEGAVDQGESANEDSNEDSSADSGSQQQGDQYHVVERGESLWAIARANSISVARLKELNDLAESDLMPGDRLRVE